MSERPTLNDAAAAVTRRKSAADTATIDTTPMAWAAALSGTDLTRDELAEFCNHQGNERGGLVVILGPASLAATCVADGILVGLELARLRDQAEGRASTMREIRRQLLELAEAVLEAHDAGELRARDVLQGDPGEFRPGDKGGEALLRAENVLEQMGRR